MLSLVSINNTFSYQEATPTLADILNDVNISIIHNYELYTASGVETHTYSINKSNFKKPGVNHENPYWLIIPAILTMDVCTVSICGNTYIYMEMYILDIILVSYYWCHHEVTHYLFATVLSFIDAFGDVACSINTKPICVINTIQVMLHYVLHLSQMHIVCR